MSMILEGISLGLVLAVSLGPIFVTLTQASIEKGALAGMAVGFGVWISDIAILVTSLVMINKISQLVNGEAFQFWLGMSGAIILGIYGLILIIKPIKPTKTQHMLSIKGFSAFFLKGVLVNAVNPFTFLFWLSVLSTYVIGRSVSNTDILTLLITIMIVIIASDCAKVFLAKLIRERMKEEHFHWISRVAGMGLILFGLVLLIRVI